MVFGAFLDASFEAFLSAPIGASKGCDHGVAEPLVGGYWRAVIPSLSATFGLLEGESGVGLNSVMGEWQGCLGGGSGEGAIFASKCILKVEYAKGAYIPGLEITRFAPEFRGFW